MKTPLLSIFLLAAVYAEPNVIADYRIRNPDITPALGRGYSLTSYDVLSTCLQFDERTEPTYNYDYQTLEFTSDGEQLTAESDSVRESVSWPFIKETISTSIRSNKHKAKHFVSTRMATERYYASINEQTATLMPDALALIQRGDLIGFFQACGTGYIRSIRRTAELAAVFEYSSSSATLAKEMAAEITDASAESSASSKNTSSNSNRKITIKGFGLGLNSNGSDTLVANTLDEYHAAVKYAFRSMQETGVGMVHGVEVMSWMNNLQFQNAVRFQRTEEIEWVLPKNEAGKDIVGANKYRSVVQGRQIAAAVVSSDGVVTSPAVFDPVYVEAIEVKAITMINAEFITGLEAYYRKEMNTVSKFVACQGKVKALMARGQGHFYLQDHTRMKLTEEDRADAWTVKEASEIMSNGNHLNKRMQSLKNFVKYFYGKCTSLISQYSDDGSMTKYWWDIPECMPTSDGSSSRPGIPVIGCLERGKDFTYIPSMDGSSGVLKCEAQAEVAPRHAAQSTATTGIHNFLDRYCMPEIDHAHTHTHSPARND